jgi:pimeloyl-ACP methyl ester carboxylesterase
MYMFEPYQRGKIPVVMIHGLLSTPLTWTTMFNDLRADPTLRDNYQFWFYLYPTGDSYLETAADLRQTLAKLRRVLDPHHQDPALDQMVLVGHSMGGLVAKLQTVQSGDSFWRLVSQQPIQQAHFQPRTRAELERLYFFESDPGIRQVIFIGTPHHGSKLSPSLPAKLAAQFVTLPKKIANTAAEAMKEDPKLGPMFDLGKDTSLDLLGPKAPALEVLAALPRAPAVHYHTILGDIYGAGKDGSDGIVPYQSAHLPEAESEVVVDASHLNIHHHPRAVLEVWRILLDHLRTVSGRDDLPRDPPAIEIPLAQMPQSPPRVVRR